MPHVAFLIALVVGPSLVQAENCFELPADLASSPEMSLSRSQPFKKSAHLGLVPPLLTLDGSHLQARLLLDGPAGWVFFQRPGYHISMVSSQNATTWELDAAKFFPASLAKSFMGKIVTGVTKTGPNQISFELTDRYHLDFLAKVPIGEWDKVAAFMEVPQAGSSKQVKQLQRGFNTREGARTKTYVEADVNEDGFTSGNFRVYKELPGQSIPRDGKAAGDIFTDFEAHEFGNPAGSIAGEVHYSVDVRGDRPVRILLNPLKKTEQTPGLGVINLLGDEFLAGRDTSRGTVLLSRTGEKVFAQLIYLQPEQGVLWLGFELLLPNKAKFDLSFPPLIDFDRIVMPVQSNSKKPQFRMAPFVLAGTRVSTHTPVHPHGIYEVDRRVQGWGGEGGRFIFLESDGYIYYVPIK